MMAITAGLNAGVLTINGSNVQDFINVQRSNDTISILGVSGSWAANSVNSITINAGDGNDVINVWSESTGGSQSLGKNITIVPSNGSDLVHLPAARDITLGGSDSLSMGSNGTVAALNGGVLKVYGTKNQDWINIQQSGGNISLLGLPGSWAATSVNSITVDAGGGNDVVNVWSESTGGTQALAKNITITPSAGSDLIHLSGFRDVTLGSSDSLSVGSNGTVAALNSGVLKVFGTNVQDFINIQQSGGNISLLGLPGYWAATSVNSITVDAGGGNDVINVWSESTGGGQALAENITIVPSAGSDLVHLKGAHDVTLASTDTLAVAIDGSVKLNGTTLNFNTPAPPTPPAPPTTNWFDTHVTDAALRSLGHSLYTDGLIDRNDMIALLRNAEDGNVIDATEFADLKAIVANTALFGTLDYVDQLAADIVNGSIANAHYQGGTLGNLAANSSSTQLENLINKWFLGLDRPTAGGTYRLASGQLFVNGVAYTDVNQGQLGDCYFMASLAETALKNPNVITSMFTVNGDGTFTARFYYNGKAQYVTVDSYLPTDSSGHLIYSGMGNMYNNASNELWVDLAEKAYAQANELGFIRPGLSGNGQNAYGAIESGYIYAALGQITGLATTPFTMTSTTNSFQTFVNAFNAGKEIGFASMTSPQSSSVVGSHAYAVVGYNAANQTVTLFNPWGIQYGLVTMTWAQIQGSFSYYDRLA